LCLTLAPGVLGQNADAAAKLQALSQQLNLTPEQKLKMLPVLKEEVPKIQAIKKNTSLSGLQKMKELRTVHNQSAPQMQQILSPEQYQKLQTIRQEEIRQAIAKKRGGG
jgi:hypothetical protein